MTYFTTGAQLQAAINDLPASKKGSFTPFDGFYYGEKYMAAYSGSLTPLEHFAQIGADRGYAPSATFDPAFYASSYADLKGKGFNSADLLYHFLQYGLDEGRVPNAALANFNATQYLVNNTDVAAAVADAIAADPTAFGGSTSNGALAHFVKFGQFESRSDENVTAGSSMRLTTGQDVLNGTANNDTFNANFADNSNTFQSGDIIDGGAGSADVLNIDLGTSSNFAILASTTGVENVFIRAQSTNANGSSGNNNVDITGEKVTVDAEKMVGVNQWWSNESRADLKIEDIRILDSQITKDITIGLRNTDAGSMGSTDQLGENKVDFEVYFSPESLRPVADNTSNAITLSVSNQVEVQQFDPAAPLKNIPYTDVTFTVNDQQVILELDLSAVSTYDDMWAAVQTALAAAKTNAVYGPLLANVTMVRSVASDSFFSKDGVLRFADEYVLTNSNGTIKPAATIGWLADGGLPPTNAFGANVEVGAQVVSNNLITSTIILDNVGREDEAGTLTIGSMSTHGGVERFEITVENNGDNAYAGTQSGSWLGHMSSTNNTLREVSVVNAAAGIANPDYLYLGTNMDQAGNNLGNQQDWPGGMDRDYDAITAVTTSLLNTDGLTDVRVFDASTFAGNVYVGATITKEAIRKYQDLVDAAADDKSEDVAFQYKTGAGNDSINLALDVTAVASNSDVVPGRHDFSFLVDGGAGDDNIQVSLVNGALSGNTENWYNNQAINGNVVVNGGAGNDTIRTPGAGNVVINAGSGNDTVYTDNTGVQAAPVDLALFNNGRAVFVFNAADGDADIDGNQYAVTDLKSQQAASVMAVNANLTVTYKGLTSTKTIGGSEGKLSNVAISDLTVNQAIKDAINTDAVLSKLLVAVDGPGRTLAVLSLIDGEVVDLADLGIAFGNTGPLTPGQVAAVPAVTLFSAAPGLNLVTDGYLTNFGQYQDGTDIVGADSTASSDNTINLGAGNDVLVLGTGANSNETVKFEAGFGNDTIVNFAVDGTGMDHLDFAGIQGTTLEADGVYTTDKAINIVDAAVVAPTLAITTKQAIEALYNANNLVAQNHVFVAVDGNNVGTVYSVADAIGAGNAVATLEGTIDLANTDWFALTNENFLPATADVLPPVEPPVEPGFTVVDLGTTNVTATAAAEAFVYDFKMVAGRATKAGDGEVVITGFDVANDKLVFNDVGTGAVLTEAQFMALAGVVIAENPFASNTSIYFDADAGILGGVTLVGIVDAALTTIAVETTA